MPLARRLPKRGFVSRNRIEYAIVNLGQLNEFPEGTVIDADLLRAKGLIKKSGDGLRVLAKGDLSTSLTIRASKFSRTAIEKIEAAGGRFETVQR